MARDLIFNIWLIVGLHHGHLPSMGRFPVCFALGLLGKSYSKLENQPFVANDASRWWELYSRDAAAVARVRTFRGWLISSYRASQELMNVSKPHRSAMREF